MCRRHAHQRRVRPGAPEELWVGTDDGSRTLVRDPNSGSAEQRRLSTLCDAMLRSAATREWVSVG